MEKKSSGGAPGWMCTYGDLMSLLLTFFILLYSFSSLDAAKFQSLASALQSVLLGDSNPEIFQDSPSSDNPVTLPIPSPDASEVESEIQEIYKEVYTFISEQGLQAEVSVRTERRGVVIDIQENVLFDSGSAVIKDESREILNKLSLIFKEIDKDTAIEGHTDNMPINTYQFPTNWELSTTRAVNVLRYFVEVNGADPTKISATGYGEYRPIASNETSEGKSRNRRVNILLLVHDEQKTVLD